MFFLLNVCPGRIKGLIERMAMEQTLRVTKTPGVCNHIVSRTPRLVAHWIFNVPALFSQFDLRLAALLVAVDLGCKVTLFKGPSLLVMLDHLASLITIQAQGSREAQVSSRIFD